MIIQVTPEIIDQGFIEIETNNFSFDVSYENLYLVENYEYIIEKIGSRARIIFAKDFFATLRPHGLVYLTWPCEAS